MRLFLQPFAANTKGSNDVISKTLVDIRLFLRKGHAANVLADAVPN